MFRLDFTSRVLGKDAMHKLRRHEVTQTLRSENSGIAIATGNGSLKIGDIFEVALDKEILGHAELVAYNGIRWGRLDTDDAHRGGFHNLAELGASLIKAGYRFQPIEEYDLYRFQFSWVVQELEAAEIK